MRCMDMCLLLSKHSYKSDFTTEYEFDQGRSLDRPKFAFNLQLFAEEKTEQPTGKRLSDARNKGNVAKSTELNAAMVLIAGFYALSMFGLGIYNEVTGFMAYTLGNLGRGASVETIMQLVTDIMLVFAKTSMPIMLVIMLVALVTNIGQVGWNFTTEPLGFKPEKLNPIAGFGRMFSKRSLVELAKSVMKIIIIGYFIYDYLKDEIPQMPKFLYIDLTASLPKIADILFSLAYHVCVVILILAVFDFAYQKWQHIQGLKMTKQEVKEEFKQMEGDPKIKSKRMQKQRQMAMQRMMQEVPKADVIITNPTHCAVALSYKKGMEAPRVLAKGVDLVAQRIKEIGREAGVTIVENKPLARSLYALVDVGGFIPPDLYKAVAEVLAYVYRLKNRYRQVG